MEGEEEEEGDEEEREDEEDKDRSYNYIDCPLLLMMISFVGVLRPARTSCRSGFISVF